MLQISGDSSWVSNADSCFHQNVQFDGNGPHTVQKEEGFYCLEWEETLADWDLSCTHTMRTIYRDAACAIPLNHLILQPLSAAAAPVVLPNFAQYWVGDFPQWDKTAF